MITTQETDNHQQAEPKPQHDQQTASNPDNAQPGRSATPDAMPADNTPQTTRKTVEKPAFDPSQPLKNERYEKMATLRVAENTQEQCYILTSKSKIRKGEAKSRASHVFARPDVSARVDWLRIQAALAPKTPQNAPGAPIPTAGKATPAVKVPRKADLALAQRKASEALYLAETPADIVKAVSACRDLGLIDTAEQAKADPTLVLQAILSYAGRTGAEICEQLGGLAFMLDKFLTVCKVSPDDLRATLAQRYPPAEPQPEPGD